MTRNSVTIFSPAEVAIAVELVEEYLQRQGRFAHRGDLVAEAAHLVALERQLVLADAERALVGDVRGRQHRMDARQRARAAGVDPPDPRMDARRAEDLRVELPGQVEVVDVARLPARLLRRIELRDALADQRFPVDDLHRVLPAGPAGYPRASRHHSPAGGPPMQGLEADLIARSDEAVAQYRRLQAQKAPTPTA